MELRATATVNQNVQRASEPLPRAAEAGAPAKAAATDLPAALAVPPSSAAAPASGLNDALHSINKTMQALSQDLEFSLDPDSNRTIVKVVDQRTHEVIRQMPSAEALEIAKALDRVQGLLIRQRA